jgi:hypothetical protein
MAIKPILFSTPMVRAILEGRKTMTRRVVKKKYSNTDLEMFTNKYGTRLIERQNDAPPNEVITQADGKTVTRRHLVAIRELDEPYKRGDILWVRETWSGVCFDCGDCTREEYMYRADGKRQACCPYDVDWRPSIFMPKAACRIFLRVTAVRAERLQEITEEDAIREGIVFTDFGMNTNRGKMSVDGGITFHQLKPEQYPGYHAGDATHPNQCLHTARSAFGNLWEEINAKRAGGLYAWEKNPWVRVVSFEPVDKPKGWPA